MENTLKIWSTELSRRSILQSAAYVAGAIPVLATVVSVNEAAAAGMPQSAVAYRPTPNGEKRCDNCALFQAPNACRNVQGTISPQGWCRIYVKKSA